MHSLRFFWGFDESRRSFKLGICVKSMSRFSFPLGSYFLRKCRLFNGMQRPWTKFIAYTWIIKLKVTSDLCKKKSLSGPNILSSYPILHRLSIAETVCRYMQWPWIKNTVLVKGARSSFLSPPEIKVKTKSYKCFLF